MKMLVWLVALTLGGIVYASPYYGELKNFNLNYYQPSGNAQSELLIFRDINYQTSTSYEVELQAGSLFLITPISTIQLDNLPAFIADVDTLTVNNLNIISHQSGIELDLEYMSSSTNSESISIEELKISCTSLTSTQDPMDQILDQCLNNAGEVSLSRFFEGSKQQLANFTMSTENGMMDFKVTAAGKTVRGEGETYFDGNTVRIKITKAKYGIFNVRGLLFRELEELASEKIKINNPWIEIDL
ncbi:MAG: hypothetical protein CME65_08855 [Halobacteriovoraceae bacterium]|nr:hypothetical protein [Halobacteriovoraceae bacterium]|tara:strand:- start:120 stop:851 length:732 start_codon:yes stop_codon:yes gene_type:complete